MKIFCIGRNYADHASEMNASVPEKPLFFMKPDTSLIRPGTPFFYPNFSNEIHFECEVVVRINKVGKNIAQKFSHTYYDEIGLGIDFTARDLQEVCKKNGHPWEIAKGFEGSAAICRNWLNKNELDVNNLNFSFEQNGTVMQKGNTSSMLFSIDEIIAYLSQFMTLKKGDLIYTGTPSGVGKVAIGDLLTGKIEGKEMFTIKVK